MVSSVPKQRAPRLWLAASNGAPRSASPAAASEPPLSGPTEVARSVDDAQLLEAMRRGDARAATPFHDRVRATVERSIGRLLGRGDADEDDLVQLALIELVTTIDRFRGDCSLDTWTSMVSARVVYKHIRRKRTERRLFASVVLDESLVISPDRMGRDAVLRSLVARLRGHLATMDPERSWTFLLHDVCGYDLREIAEITGASISAAQTRLSRGRRALHDLIGGDSELAGCLEDILGDP